MAQRVYRDKNGYGRRVGFNVGFKRHFDETNPLRTGRMSAMSREFYNDVIQFEEEIASLHIKITGVAGRSTQEDDRRK